MMRPFTRRLRQVLAVALCLAVFGSDAAPGVSRGHRSGSAWTLTSAAPVSGGGPPLVSLQGVSCVTAEECFAVGSGETSRNASGVALVEEWNGMSWTISFVDAVALSRLDAVSCSSPIACVAVGGSGANDAQLTATWNGSTWTAQTDTGIGAPEALSCASATMCIAVGSGAEAWNGVRWTPMRTPQAPDGYARPQLTGVSCVSTTWCTAVGSMTHGRRGTGTVPLAERWDGRAWMIEPTELRTPTLLRRTPPAEADYVFHAVSCVAVKACVAVGYESDFEADINPAVPIAGHWNGRIWHIGPAAGKKGIPLDGISCPSASACIAVAAGDITGGSLQIEA